MVSLVPEPTSFLRSHTAPIRQIKSIGRTDCITKFISLSAAGKFRENLRLFSCASQQYFNYKKWKEKSGYHKHSLSETAMYRVKQLLGGALTLRNYNAQVEEITP